MDDTLYDVVVVGAGIQGAGVAQACAVNGLRTLVLEKAPRPACGTSSRSSKLIHGGLRYLETAQFRLVYECLQERALLCRIAPSLVSMKTFYLPVYRDTRRSAWWIHTGLAVYWALSGFNRDSAFRSEKIGVAERAGLRTAGLSRLFSYRDAQTDDRALTEAVLNSAIQHGARCEFNQELVGVRHRDGVYHLETASAVEFKGRVLINAAGPWVNHVAGCFSDPVETLDISLVQGTHLVIAGTGIRDYFYLESPQDGRPVFVLPWKGDVLLGTTERVYSGNPDDVASTAEEASYLLDTFHHYFPLHTIGPANIQEHMAGLRVLPADQRNLNRKPRDTILLTSEHYPHYLAIYGGKLTAYRSTSERVVRKLMKWLDFKRPYQSTRNLFLG